MTVSIQEIYNKEIFSELSTDGQIYRLLKMHNNDIDILKNLSDEEFQPLLFYLRSVNIPSKDKRLLKLKVNLKVAKRKWSLTDIECFESCDTYYRNCINDILRQIRDKKSKDKTAYCHHFYHIKELLKFEPNIEVKLDKGIFEVRLNK